jgi:2,4-dienoyl-CoA reductase-like NADH-dependent reductase (Old Yellow Enzyme family)
LTTAFPHLFEPVRIGRREAKNRIMRVATTCNLAAQSRVTDRQIEFYRTVARGGVGSIVSEAFRASPEGPAPLSLLAFDRGMVPGLRKLAAAIHEHDVVFIAQLAHGGRQHLARRVPPALVGPSPVACPRSGGVPHELTIGEIEQIIEFFAMSALHCIEGDCDGVEIHSAQGHLVQQFLSPFSNRRDDRYGGSFENRLRFAREVIAAVRRRVGQTPIVGLRFGVEEFTEGGLTIEDTAQIAAALNADGVLDYLSLAQGNFNTIETHLPDRHYPILAFRSQHARIKQAAPDLAVIGSTRIQTPEQAESMLAAGEADLIGLCRPLVVDPQWPNKAREARSNTIRKCIACNQCWGSLSEGEPMSCATNPEAGREWLLGPLTPAEIKRHVVVIGGGPAGLEAARTARLRGHRVTLFEAADALGGKMRAVPGIKHHEETRHLLDFLVPQVVDGGTAIRLNSRADLKTVLAEKPDAVVLATGAAAFTPDVPGDGSVPVLAPTGPVKLESAPGSHVVIMDEDGYFWGAAVAESTTQSGYRVTHVTRVFEPFREIPVVSRVPTLRALDRDGAEFRPNSEIARIERGGVVLRHYLSGREQRLDDVAALLWIGAQRQDNSLRDELKAIGFDQVHIVGDAVSPRRLRDALQEAHLAARRI